MSISQDTDTQTSTVQLSDMPLVFFMQFSIPFTWACRSQNQNQNQKCVEEGGEKVGGKGEGGRAEQIIFL